MQYVYTSIREYGWPCVCFHRATEVDNGISRDMPVETTLWDVCAYFDRSRVYLLRAFADVVCWMVMAFLGWLLVNGMMLPLSRSSTRMPE